MEEADRPPLAGEPVSELPRCLLVARPLLGVRGEDLAPDRDTLIHELLAEVHLAADQRTDPCRTIDVR